jgi:hypothetical protein
MSGDLVAEASERRRGQPLLEPHLREGNLERRESMNTLRDRGFRSLSELPSALRHRNGTPPPPYPVTLSQRLLAFLTP